jgi:hypothetical protein
MQFRYTEVKSGLFRPLLSFVIWGPAGPVWTDGLLDSGADRTVLTPDLAKRLGINIRKLAPELHIASATGQRLRCRIVTVPLELWRNRNRICWRAEVAVATSAIQRSHWGFKGFLEFFRTTFDGPKRTFTLKPGVNLPAMDSPSHE